MCLTFCLDDGNLCMCDLHNVLGLFTPVVHLYVYIYVFTFMHVCISFEKFWYYIFYLLCVQYGIQSQAMVFSYSLPSSLIVEKRLPTSDLAVG